MMVSLNKNIYTNKQNQNKLICHTDNRLTLKSKINKDNISFSGYWSRVEAKKGNQSSWDWFWGGEEAAKEQVTKEMREEINSLIEQIAVKKAYLSGLRDVLSDLIDNHSKVKASKKSQLKALKNVESDHNETIEHLKKIKRIKDQTIKETDAGNQKLNQILEEQKRAIKKATMRNKKLNESITPNKQQNEQKLKSELEEQGKILDATHNAEMDELARKINQSIKVPDPIKKAASLSKPDGFGKIAGYSKQKNILIKYFGAPVFLEKGGKPTEIPNGILLFGPKGCGKSIFADSIAKQFECDIIEIPDALNPKVNIRNLRGAATQAQKNFEVGGKRTILLIDNFEDFAPKGSQITGVLKGFMDNVSKDYHCTVVATTKYPEKIDDILLRDGRFHKICIPPPDQENSIAVLKHYSKDFIDNSFNYDKLYEKIAESFSDGVFSNLQLKTIMQPLNQETLVQNITKLGPDIDEYIVKSFEKQIELVKHI